jgi:hypothetical protein
MRPPMAEAITHSTIAPRIQPSVSEYWLTWIASQMPNTSAERPPTAHSTRAVGSSRCATRVSGCRLTASRMATNRPTAATSVKAPSTCRNRSVL